MKSISGADEKVLNGHDDNNDAFDNGSDQVLISLTDVDSGLKASDQDNVLYLRLLETDMFCHLWHDY